MTELDRLRARRHRVAVEQACDSCGRRNGTHQVGCPARPCACGTPGGCAYCRSVRRALAFDGPDNDSTDPGTS